VYRGGKRIARCQGKYGLKGPKEKGFLSIMCVFVYFYGKIANLKEQLTSPKFCIMYISCPSDRGP